MEVNEKMKPVPFLPPEPGPKETEALEKWADDMDPAVATEIVCRMYPSAVSMLN